MVLEVVKYGNEVLRERAVPVAAVTPALVKLAQDMIETMHRTRGVGLAAEQVGRLESLCVIDVPPSCEDTDEIRDFNAAVEMPLVMFNPVIVATEGSQDGKEGCLSFPNMSAPVTRPAQVTCQFTGVDGAPHMVTAKGFLARALMHETDHLQGVLYIDHLSAVDKIAMAKKVQKLAQKNGGRL